MFELEDQNEQLNHLIQQNREYAKITKNSVKETEQLRNIMREKDSELMSLRENQMNLVFKHSNRNSNEKETLSMMN